MIISTCGFGNTGASAVLDFLQGYPDLQRIANFEFQLFHMADGINDLKYALTVSRERVACNCAIKRFERAALHGRVGRMMSDLCGPSFEELTKSYIHELIQVSWMGYSRYDPTDVTNRVQDGVRGWTQAQLNRILRKISHKYHYPRHQRRYLAVMSADRFDAVTREYFVSCLKAAGLDPDKDILTDVLFSAMNPRQGTEFVKDPKIILVFRDPRDLFIRATEHQATNGHTPCQNVEEFITYYRTLMENLVPYENSLSIQYEDLIYHYYPTTKKIMAYLGFEERPQNEFTYFDPDKSVKYTKAWNTYKGHEEEKKRIEEALPEYLYNFPKYQKVKDQEQAYKGEKS